MRVVAQHGVPCVHIISARAVWWARQRTAAAAWVLCEAAAAAKQPREVSSLELHVQTSRSRWLAHRQQLTVACCVVHKLRWAASGSCGRGYQKSRHNVCQHAPVGVLTCFTSDCWSRHLAQFVCMQCCAAPSNARQQQHSSSSSRQAMTAAAQRQQQHQAMQWQQQHSGSSIRQAVAAAAQRQQQPAVRWEQQQRVAAGYQMSRHSGVTSPRFRG